MHELSVGLLGCGVVGSAVANRLVARDGLLAKRLGCGVKLARVAVRHVDKPRPVALTPGVVTNNALCVATDPGVDVVVEAIGGVAAAAALVTAALDAGKSVVTANKQLLAARGPDLERIAAANGVRLCYEAAVGGAVPIVRVLRESLRGDTVDRIDAVLNGTTNYVLTAMVEREWTMEEALADARARGYAEADADADIGGQDAAAKAKILARLCFPDLHVAELRVTSTASVSRQAALAAQRDGMAVKQLVSVVRRAGAVAIDVAPVPLPLAHPLGALSGVDAGVVVECSAGRLVLSGPGAGGEATASAVLGDLTGVLAGLLDDAM